VIKIGQEVYEKAGIKNNVSVKDDIGQDIEAEMIEALEREVALFNKNLDKIEADKENFVTQWKVDNELYQLMIEGSAKVPEHRVFEYEQSDRYWELRKQQLEFKYRQDKFMSEQRLGQYDTSKLALQEQLDSSQSKLTELKGE